MDTLVLHGINMSARSDEDEEVLPPSPEEAVSGDEFGVPDDGGAEVGNDYQMDDDIENPDAY